MHVLDTFEQRRGLCIVTECREDEDEVLDHIRIYLLGRLDFSHELLAVGVLPRLHQAVSLQSIEECALRGLHQT